MRVLAESGMGEEAMDDDLWREQLRDALKDLEGAVMPFGKYKGRLLVALPDEYLMWFKERGFPQGRLGELMTFVYEVKMAGAEEVFAPIRRRS